jgi:Mg2+-importing ATPase
VDVAAAAALPVSDVAARLSTTMSGLSGAEADRRRTVLGANTVSAHRTRAGAVLLRQFRSPLLILLAITAVASCFVGERGSALIIAVILLASVGLGFANEYRAERAADALHSQIRHRCTVRREDRFALVDVIDLVPGDVVELRAGEVVPADVRLVGTTALTCQESILTGEAAAVAKTTDPVAAGAPLAELACCALMGTVVAAGSGRGLVVATGTATEFGRLAVRLGTERPPTEFQLGLRRFSLLLVRVAAVLTAGIFAANLVLHRPVLDALMFSLAIAVGISPQLLPAVVSTSLAAGSRRLARARVLVKRLVCIEDLGDVEVLFTDKTGTLTEGQVRYMRAVGPDGRASDDPLFLGLLCNEAVVEGGHPTDGNPLDVALWEAPAAASLLPRISSCRRRATLPFDHVRRTGAVLVDDQDATPTLILKGAPEQVLDRCTGTSPAVASMIEAESGAGNRVIAVASRTAPGRTELGTDADVGGDLEFRGLLVFADPPKPTARAALDRLHALGVTVKVLTGDHPAVAARVAADLGLPAGRVVTGPDVDAADDARLAELIAGAAVFARVDPVHKARIVAAQRRTGVDVAFLGDGVNDAAALHAADVGISVDSATDVAKDAADVLLLDKDLDVLADGVRHGRRIFANTMKYVLMGTSSNFGNMFSAAGASLFLPFLPMLPSQILLNNLLYDTSQLAIPTDEVDDEQTARPSRWDVAAIRRFMLFFGPLSSLFDFATFAILLWGFHAHATSFRTGWFVESLATQTLIVFAIRTRRTPFFRSRPSLPLTLAVLGVVACGALLPSTPLAGFLGFQPLPGAWVLAIAALTVTYLALIEVAKRVFYRRLPPVPPVRSRRPGHRLHRRAARFTYAGTNGPGQQGHLVHAGGTSVSSLQRGLWARLGPYR